jgi:hypothetical protein
LGGMAGDVCFNGDVDRYLMLRKKGRLSKSIEGRMWWKLWEYAGMASARLWRGFRAYIVARPKRQRPPDQQLAGNRPFLFRKDLVFCVQFVICCRLMSLADWAKFGGGMVGLSGSSRVCCSLPHFVSRLSFDLDAFDDPHHPRPLDPARGHAPYAFAGRRCIFWRGHHSVIPIPRRLVRIHRHRLYQHRRCRRVELPCISLPFEDDG